MDVYGQQVQHPVQEAEVAQTSSLLMLLIVLLHVDAVQLPALAGAGYVTTGRLIHAAFF